VKNKNSFSALLYPFIKKWFDYISWISISSVFFAVYKETGSLLMLIISWFCGIFLLGFTHVFFMDNIVYKLFPENWVKKNRIGIIVILLAVVISVTLQVGVSRAITSLIRNTEYVK